MSSIQLYLLIWIIWSLKTNFDWLTQSPRQTDIAETGAAKTLLVLAWIEQTVTKDISAMEMKTIVGLTQRQV